MADQPTEAHPAHRNRSSRTRIVVRLLVFFAIIGVSLFLIGRAMLDHRRSAAAEDVAPTIATSVAILPDGNIMFAPNGSIAQSLTDWLENNDGRPRYFEVGGQQFVGKAVVPTTSAQARLPQLVKIMQAYPDLKLVIVGHTDDRGSAAENEVVSRKRAKWLENYLESYGIDQKRLSVRAAGAAQPVADDETQAGRDANNRIGLALLPHG